MFVKASFSKFIIFKVKSTFEPICTIKICLKEIFANQFQTCLLPTFIILQIFKFFIQFTINPMRHRCFQNETYSNLHSCIYVKNYHIFKWDFR
jgi:hypothetical protein